MECYICFESMNNKPRITLCGNEHHSVCLGCWQRQEHKEQCPYCRQETQIEFLREERIVNRDRIMFFQHNSHGFYINRVEGRFITTIHIKIEKQGNLKSLTNEKIEKFIRDYIYNDICLLLFQYEKTHRSQMTLGSVPSYNYRLDFIADNSYFKLIFRSKKMEHSLIALLNGQQQSD